MRWLDWWLFGNGWGMASPYFDDAFYWLHDMNAGRRNTRGSGGQFYRWSAGFGAQLHSVEWFVPRAGTRRRLFGHDFVLFSAHRKGPRVDVAWELDGGIQKIEQLTDLKKALQAWGHGI